MSKSFNRIIPSIILFVTILGSLNPSVLVLGQIQTQSGNVHLNPVQSESKTNNKLIPINNYPNSAQENNINTINSVSSTQQINSFSYQGSGNNTLVKENETFSIETTYQGINSIPFNSKNITNIYTIPTYTNYKLTSGQMSFSNATSTIGTQTVEGSNRYTNLNYPQYNGIAGTFYVSKTIEIPSFYINIIGSGIVTINASIRELNNATGGPNGTILMTSKSQFNNPNGWNLISPGISKIFEKGNYSIVITWVKGNSLTFPVVMDNSTGDGTNTEAMWTNSGVNWTSYPADVPFYYNYVILNSPNPYDNLTYSNPYQINFLMNNTQVSSFSNTYSLNPLANKSFTIFTNASISFDINYFLTYTSNSLNSVSSSYNITESSELWSANIAIASLPIASPSTTFNSVIIRNITLLYLPYNWVNSNLIYNGSIRFYSPKTIYSNPSFMFQILGSSSQGNFKCIFSTPNYITSLDVFNANNQSLGNLYLPVNYIYHFAGSMYPSPTKIGNISMGLYNSSNSLIVEYTNPNATILNNYLVFPSFNISSYYSPNSQFQGVYTLNFFWSNPNLTKVGYYQVDIYFIIQTKLNLIAKNGFVNNSSNVVKISSSVNMLFTFTDLLNSSLISNSSISFYFTNEYGGINSNLQGLTVDSSSNKINISIDTNPTSLDFYRVGKFNLTIIVSKFGFENQTQSFLFNITGYNIKIDLSYNKRIIRGQDFTVKAVVSSTDHLLTSLQLKTATSTGQPVLSNLLITIKFAVVFQNNTQSTISSSSYTDQTGTAYIELNSSVTKDINSINGMEADFNGNNLINAYQNTIVNPTIQFVGGSNLFTLVNIILLIIIIIITTAVALSAYYFFNDTYSKSKENKQKYSDYIDALTDFLGMYITNKQGLPIFLKSNQLSEDQNQHLMLSGVTYSIDLFLSNFKEEYTRTVTKETSILASENTGLVNMTVIDQQNFKILIGVSDSYRMYVLIKQTNPRIIKLFQDILDNIEKSIKIENTIINLERVHPLFVNEINKAFPIEIVNEFEIKFERLVSLIIDPNQTLVSSSTISKLKAFCFYLVKNFNVGVPIVLNDDFDFKSILTNSKRITIQNMTLRTLKNILESLKCSKKEIYEIYYICSGYKASIFKNITPINIPEPITSPSSD